MTNCLTECSAKAQPALGHLLVHEAVANQGAMVAAPDDVGDDRGRGDLHLVLQLDRLLAQPRGDQLVEALGQHKREPDDVTKLDRVGIVVLRQPFRRADEHDLVLRDLQPVQSGDRAEIRHERQIDLRFLQPVVQHDAEPFDDPELDQRITLPHLVQQARRDQRCEGRRKPEHDLAGGLGGQLVDAVLDLGHVAENEVGLLPQPGSGLGQFDALGSAHEQFDADLVLERLDVPAQGGLGNAELHGRPAEAALPGDGREVAQLP